MIGFTKILPDALAQYEIPGLSVAGFVGDQRFHWAGGVRDLEGGGAIDADTLFPIASCTKPVTAALVLAQVAAGKAGLDDRIRDHLPEFRLADPVAGAEMTLRDLLCHRTGLPPHTWAWVYGRDSRDDFMFNRLPHLASMCGFRERHAYSNIMYAFAGTLLKHWTGKPWEELVDPGFVHLDGGWFERPNVALPYRDGKRIPFFHAEQGHLIAPASELMASARGLASWLQMADVESMAVSQVKVSDRTEYGLGWRISNLATGEREVWHSGQCSGYTAWMSSVPELNTGIVLLCNRHGSVGELEAVAASFYAHMAGRELGLKRWAKTARSSKPRAAWELVNQSFKPARYENPGYGSFELKGRQGIFQGVGPFDLLQDEKQRLGFELPIYGARFLADRSNDRLAIRFDSKVPPVEFLRV